jgi:uncharacterized protein (TIGR00251 family)
VTVGSSGPAASCAGVSKGFVTRTRDGARVKLRVSPGARSTSISGAYGEDAIKLRVAAPPVEGRANAEVERYVAELLRVTASDVSVVGGVAGRNKAVLVRGIEAETVREILTGHLS